MVSASLSLALNRRKSVVVAITSLPIVDHGSMISRQTIQGVNMVSP